MISFTILLPDQYLIKSRSFWRSQWEEINVFVFLVLVCDAPQESMTHQRKFIALSQTNQKTNQKNILSFFVSLKYLKYVSLCQFALKREKHLRRKLFKVSCFVLPLHSSDINPQFTSAPINIRAVFFWRKQRQETKTSMGLQLSHLISFWMVFNH